MSDNGNPFDAPLASETQDHQAAQAATVSASDNGNPFNEPLLSEKAEATHAAAVAQPSGYVPNARIRNLPNPAEGMTPGEALVNGAATGAGVAALPASSAVGDAVAPVVGTVIEHLNSLDKIVKAAKALGYGTFTLKEAHDLYKMVSGDKK
jgi:hypothetical protein